MPIDDRESPSSLSEIDSALGTNTTSPSSGRKSHSGCSSMSDRDEESFVCYGENEDIECDLDSSPHELSRDVVDDSIRSPPSSLPPSSLGVRNSWVRRSLRGSPNKSSDSVVTPKRWGSFRHKPRRDGSFHSPTLAQPPTFRLGQYPEEQAGDRCFPIEDYVTIHEKQEDAHYLKEKVQMLQQQVGVLADNQINTDDRYTRAKQDNSALQARVMMLEEQLRDVEMRAEERLSEEQRRNRELVTRIEREKLLTVENYSIKLTSAEKEKNAVTEDNKRLKNQIEKLQKDKSHLEDKVAESEFTVSGLTQENTKMAEVSRREKEELRIERERGSQVIEELRCEVERLRAIEESYRKRSPSVDSTSGNSLELLSELKAVKEERKLLVEQVEDLQAQLLTSRLEEGRTLISATSNSLAAEFEQMTNDEDDHSGMEVVELRKSAKEFQEENDQLRSYIDGILLNIVENHPELLEVKQK